MRKNTFYWLRSTFWNSFMPLKYRWLSQTVFLVCSLLPLWVLRIGGCPRRLVLSENGCTFDLDYGTQVYNNYELVLFWIWWRITHKTQWERRPKEILIITITHKKLIWEEPENTSRGDLERWILDQQRFEWPKWPNTGDQKEQGLRMPLLATASNLRNQNTSTRSTENRTELVGNVKREKRLSTSNVEPNTQCCIHRRRVTKHHQCHWDLVIDAISQPIPQWRDGRGKHRVIARQHKSLEHQAIRKENCTTFTPVRTMLFSSY